jgi:hypothetical protein
MSAEFDKEKARRTHDLEQSGTFLTRQMPEIWWTMFNNLKGEGFSEEQAFRIVTVHVFGMGGGKLQS